MLPFSAAFFATKVDYNLSERKNVNFIVQNALEINILNFDANPQLYY